MTERELKTRTKEFALRVMRVVDALPRKRSATVIGGQLLRSGTSVGANYRAACRAKSIADFVAKLAIVEEELDESAHWLELIVEAGLLRAARLAPLRKEADELISIVVASIKTSRPFAKASRRQAIQNPKSKIQNRPGGAEC